jgi:hypothetical protein
MHACWCWCWTRCRCAITPRALLLDVRTPVLVLDMRPPRLSLSVLDARLPVLVLDVRLPLLELRLPLLVIHAPHCLLETRRGPRMRQRRSHRCWMCVGAGRVPAVAAPAPACPLSS